MLPRAIEALLLQHFGVHFVRVIAFHHSPGVYPREVRDARSETLSPKPPIPTVHPKPASRARRQAEKNAGGTLGP